MLGQIEDALNRLARVDVEDDGVMDEIEDVERALERIRDVLARNRWF
jgi:archaellum component FlaC